MKGKNKNPGMCVASLLAVIVMMVSLLSIPAQAHGYHPWYVEGTLTMYPYQEFGSTTLSHFNEAFWQWNKECTSYSLQRSLTVHSSTDFWVRLSAGKPDENKIYKIRDYDRIDVPGAAHVTKTTAGKVTKASISLNPNAGLSNGAAANTYDVWTVFIHEAGHVLGFDHCEYDSVMNVYPQGTLKRTLTNNDTYSIKQKY